MKGTPIKRRTPLKRTGIKRNMATLLENQQGFQRRRTTAIRLRSVSEREWERWRQHERVIVKERARGICEAPTGEGLTRCINEGEHVHHTFGRKQEPWSSWNPLSLLLCFDHHEQVTGRIGTGLNKPLRQELRAMAARRLAQALGGVPSIEQSNDSYVAWAQTYLSNAKIAGRVPFDYDTFSSTK